MEVKKSKGKMVLITGNFINYLGLNYLLMKTYCSNFRNIFNVLMYNLGYILMVPFLALMEMGIAFKNAILQRDFEMFQEKNVVKVDPFGGIPNGSQLSQSG